MKRQLLWILFLLVGCSDSDQESKDIEADIEKTATMEASVPVTPPVSVKPTIFECIRQGNFEEFRNYISSGIDVEIKSETGVSLLGEAVIQGNIEFVKAIIDEGVNVSQAFQDPRMIVFQEAAAKGDDAFVKTLINEGLGLSNNDFFMIKKIASLWRTEDLYLDYYEDEFKTILGGYSGWWFSDDCLGALAEAACNGYPQFIQVLRQQFMMDEFAPSYTLPLREAARRNDIEMMRLLINSGGDVNESFAIGSIDSEKCQKAIKLFVDEGFSLNDSKLKRAARAGGLNTFKLLFEAYREWISSRPVQEQRFYNRDYKDYLKEAAKGGHADIVEFLLNKNVRIDSTRSRYKFVTCFGETVLSMAAAFGHLDIVKMLIDEGANPAEALEWAIRFGQMEVFDHILNSGVQIEEKEIDLALSRAIQRDNIDAVKSLLAITTKENINKAVSSAAYYEKIGLVKLLLQAGADANSDSSHKALLRYVWENNYDAVKAFIDAGANPDFESSFQHYVSDDVSNPYNTPRRKWLKEQLFPHEHSMCLFLGGHGQPIIVASWKESHTRILNLLVKSGADVDYNKESYTPLIVASVFGNAPAVKSLVDAGANVDIKSREGETALVYAVRYERFDIVKILVEGGADKTCKGRNGESLLALASKHKNKEIFRLLKEK